MVFGKSIQLLGVQMTNNLSIGVGEISLFGGNLDGLVATPVSVRVVWVSRAPTDNYQTLFGGISARNA